MKNVIKTVIGVTFILVGMAVYLYPNYREWELKKSLSSIQIHSHRNEERENEEEHLKDTKPEEGTLAEETVSLFFSTEKSEELYEEMFRYNMELISEKQDIADVWDFRQTPVDLSGLSNEAKAIGSIELSDIGLTLPLFIGASEENMSKGAVVLAGTSMPIGGSTTNCVIAAHRGWSGSPYFRDIDQLKIGSLVKISNPWDVLLYQVTGTEIIHATENEILSIQPGKDMVTLFSCYPYGHVGTKYRQVIFCERVSDENSRLEESIDIRQMTDQIVREKGIVIEENLVTTLSEKEDLLRIVLPLAFACLVLLRGLLRWIRKH